MTLKIKIENFEGPFDLLLHLIKKNEMDIYDIKIYEITNQYLQFIEQMKEMDLEVTSEFVVIAATLLEIKSKMLLPKAVSDEVAADQENDPRKELVSKLIEYKRFKQMAEHFKELEAKAGTVFSKKPEIIEDNSEGKNSLDVLKEISILQLYNLYTELMNRYNSKINTETVIQREIPVDVYKIEDKMLYLTQKIKNGTHMHFSDLMMECGSKMEVVVTFLALLELIKQKNIKVVQEDNFTEIYLERTENNEKNVYQPGGDGAIV
ncbi:segregation/condensation protein A [Clostridium swellfunianum]|uniref:segregation/condensation protein A n=1 Tax=Clostridium swellfunianum TaxID=1367462 RepID=UPI00202E0DF7|nr:segregation/condensation protein A [Clostridium swellfunianum]MCM0648982.1 segregation/condensation protein A [Clostridium swellfunianum]